MTQRIARNKIMKFSMKNQPQNVLWASECAFLFTAQQISVTAAIVYLCVWVGVYCWIMNDVKTKKKENICRPKTNSQNLHNSTGSSTSIWCGVAYSVVTNFITQTSQTDKSGCWTTQSDKTTKKRVALYFCKNNIEKAWERFREIVRERVRGWKDFKGGPNVIHIGTRKVEV